MYSEFVEEELQKASVNEKEKVGREARAICLIEAFEANVEKRNPNPRQKKNRKKVKSETCFLRKPNSQAESKLHLTKKIQDGKRMRDIHIDIQDMFLDERGIVEVWCTAVVGGQERSLDLPIYIVNPVLIVPTSEAEDEYVEDPLSVLVDNIADLVNM